MEYMTKENFKNNVETVLNLAYSGNEIVITNEGKPSIVLVSVKDEYRPILLEQINKAKGYFAINNLRNLVNGFEDSKQK